MQSIHPSCRPGLGAAGPAGRRLGRTDGQVQSGSSPDPGLTKDTGNILGAGTALQAEYKISGTKYYGAPPPIIGVNFYLPKGSVLHPNGFPTCSQATGRTARPDRLPKAPQGGGRSAQARGPRGPSAANVSKIDPIIFLRSTKRVAASIFFTEGRSPVSLEILSPGHYKNYVGGGGYGPELKSPCLRSRARPGAPFASVKTIKVKAGSAIGPKNNPKKDTYYGRVPKVCPKGGFPRQDRSDLRRKRRRVETGPRDGAVQGAVPEEVGATGGFARSRA